MLLALKHCPRCGYFDRGVAKHNRDTVRAALVTSTIVLGVIALSLFAIPAVSRLVFAVTLGVLALACAAIVQRVRTKFPQSVESRVILVGSVPTNDGWF